MISILNKVLRKLTGYEIHYTRNKTGGYTETMRAGLERISKHGLEIKTVIDVGASNGMWTTACLDYFPQADYLLVEAQSPHEPALIASARQNPKVQYVIAAAGAKPGEVFFDVTDLFGGKASEVSINSSNVVRVPAITLDDEVARRKLDGPYMIKLDTHGFELPILQGAEKTLSKANILVIEVYNFDIAPEAARFAQLCLWLEERGFRPADMVDVMRRSDGMLWQLDIFFVRKDAAPFKVNGYR